MTSLMCILLDRPCNMPKTPSYHRGGSNQVQSNYIMTSTEGQVHISRSSKAQPLYTEKTAAIEVHDPCHRQIRSWILGQISGGIWASIVHALWLLFSSSRITPTQSLILKIYQNLICLALYLSSEWFFDLILGHG